MFLNNYLKDIKEKAENESRWKKNKVSLVLLSQALFLLAMTNGMANACYFKACKLCHFLILRSQGLFVIMGCVDYPCSQWQGFWVPRKNQHSFFCLHWWHIFKQKAQKSSSNKTQNSNIKISKTSLKAHTLKASKTSFKAPKFKPQSFLAICATPFFTIFHIFHKKRLSFAKIQLDTPKKAHFIAYAKP